MQKRQYENIRWDFPSRCWGQNSTSLRSFSRPHKCICINAQCKYLTAVTNGVRATNEAILELIWRWSSGVLHGSSSLCLLPLMHAEQCEQTDQLMVKWHDKVWKWRTVTTHTHNGWLNPVSPAGPRGPSYQAGTFSTFHSLPLNPFMSLHYMSTVAHCLHQRLCVSAMYSCIVVRVCVCVYMQCKKMLILSHLINYVELVLFTHLFWRLISPDRLSQGLE